VRFGLIAALSDGIGMVARKYSAATNIFCSDIFLFLFLVFLPDIVGNLLCRKPRRSVMKFSRYTLLQSADQIFISLKSLKAFLSGRVTYHKIIQDGYATTIDE
jgi:hypothetical protein